MPNYTVKQIHTDVNLGNAEVGDYFVGQKGTNDEVTGTLTFAPTLSMDPDPTLAADLDLNGNNILGNLRVQNYNSGTDASSLTFLRGDATWAAPPPPTPAALTKVDDTNVTITLGGSPSTALLQTTSLTMGWSGQLTPARGGTGVNNGSNTLTLAGNLATSGSFSSTFTMSGTTNVAFPTSGTLATTAQLPTPAALTKVDDTNVTLTLGGTPATSLLQATSLTLGWSGQLAVSRGGTGISSFGTGVATALGQNVSGSGSIALNTSPTFITPTLGAASATSLSFSSTSGIIGTSTNDNAAAGSVGECVNSQIAFASAVSLTTATDTNLISISLSAGDWDVSANVFFNGNSATNSNSFTTSISTTSATQSDQSLRGQVSTSTAGTLVLFNVQPASRRLSLSATTTVYCVVSAAFTAGSLTACGLLEARRVR